MASPPPKKPAINASKTDPNRPTLHLRCRSWVFNLMNTRSSTLEPSLCGAGALFGRLAARNGPEEASADVLRASEIQARSPVWS